MVKESPGKSFQSVDSNLPSKYSKSEEESLQANFTRLLLKRMFKRISTRVLWASPMPAKPEENN